MCDPSNPLKLNLKHSFISFLLISQKILIFFEFYTEKTACTSRVPCFSVPCHFFEIKTTLNNYMVGLLIAQAIGHAHGTAREVHTVFTVAIP